MNTCDIIRRMLREILFTPLGSYPFVWSVIILLCLFALVWGTFYLRLRYERYKFLTKTKWTVLEVVIPDEIRRSPEAMEIFFINAVWWNAGQTGNKYKTYYKGQTRLTFSFEIVSLGGVVHFFMHVPTKLADMVKSQFYAQYPQVEISEVPDYSYRVPMQLRPEMGMDMFAWEYKFERPDALPIRTYRDWGTDKSIELDRDQQIDPLVAVIEKIAGIDPWEEIWIQIVTRIEKDDDWRKEGEKIVDEMVTKHRRVVQSTSSDYRSTPMISTLTKGEQESLDAIDRHISMQHVFGVGIRSVYLTRRADTFNSTRVTFLKSIFEPFNSKSINAFKKINGTGFDNPWADNKSGFLANYMKDFMLERYRQRWFFDEKPTTKHWFWDNLLRLSGDYKHITMIMTSEELATIFHLPAGFAQSPSVKRTDTTTAQPPSNLPI